MRIRHIVAIDNVDAQGYVIDPLLVRHGIVLVGQIGDLAGPIDPQTHLNRDFLEHRLEECLLAERLERGAALLRDGDRFRMALVRALGTIASQVHAALLTIWGALSQEGDKTSS